METKLKILGFAGSLRVGSYNKALLRAAIDLLPDDTTLETFDLNGIPPFNQDENACKGKGVQIKNKGSKRNIDCYS
jgi:NAD(P)H-dependent FMN reductase